MSETAQKVETLIEAMPYLQKYAGKIVVIKYGGNAMINEELKNAVLHESAEAGKPIVIQLAPEGECPQFMPPTCRIIRLMAP